MTPTSDIAEGDYAACIEELDEKPRWWWLGVLATPGTFFGMVAGVLLTALPFAVWVLYTEGLVAGGVILSTILLMALTIVLLTYLSVVLLDSQ